MYQIPVFSVTLTKTQEGGARSRQRYHSLFLSTIYSSTVRLKLSDASPKTSSLQKKSFWYKGYTLDLAKIVYINRKLRVGQVSFEGEGIIKISSAFAFPLIESEHSQLEALAPRTPCWDEFRLNYHFAKNWSDR